MTNYQHLTLTERSLIGRWKKEQLSLREIARRLGRAPSTVSREIKRNYSGFGYACHLSHDKATYRRTRASRGRKKIRPENERIIRDCIEKRFSPEQIASIFLRSTGIKISAVSIYRWIYKYHGGGRQGLCKKLRRKGKSYRKYSPRRALLESRTMIDQRPRNVNEKRFYGDWEADLMLGPYGTKRALLVLVERKTKFTLIRTVRDRKAKTVSQAILKALSPYRVRTITYDNGSEFARFEEVAQQTSSKAYFCFPYHAWQKGLVENTIGLLREYFPKASKQPLPAHYQIYRRVASELNERPRKTLSFAAPRDFEARLLKANINLST